jgi:translation initiation factor RLI1
MPKPKAVIDYTKCHPERCDAGVCAAVSECAHGILKQDAPWEAPYTLQDFCVGCGKCSIACPFKAIKMVE